MLIPNIFKPIVHSQHQHVTLLGGTGSIGESSLKVFRDHSEHFTLFAVSAGSNVEALKKIIDEFSPHYAVLSLLDNSQLGSAYNGTKILYGANPLKEISTDPHVTTVISAIVGVAALPPTYSAIMSGKKVVLANKESVICGAHLFPSQADSLIVPADSEHCSIFQSLAGLSREEVKSIILTASGGPFRNRSREELSCVTVSQALTHPTWSMGRKISIDSATMMNKALEYLEAHFLFGGIPIEVVVHPQSLVHGGVRLIDGSILMHASMTDMQLPLSFALNYPTRRGGLSVNQFELKSSPLEFYPLDEKRFPALRLAKMALEGTSGLPCVFNSANEKAVELFLSEKIGFHRVEEVVESAMRHFNRAETTSVDDVMMLDSEVKAWVQSHNL